MRLAGEQMLLRIHLTNFVRWKSRPLYEVVVERARQDRLSGATVLCGIAGFHGAGPLLSEKAAALQVERPVVVEIVDEESRLRGFLAALEPMLAGHPVLVTLELAEVVHYRSATPKGAKP